MSVERQGMGVFGQTGEEELDFIINYDIKYRMGKELGNGEEEEAGDSEE